MTDEMMALRGLMEKSADADLLREMIGFGCSASAAARKRDRMLDRRPSRPLTGEDDQSTRTGLDLIDDEIRGDERQRAL